MGVGVGDGGIGGIGGGLFFGPEEPAFFGGVHESC